jgi:hypothetical protein
MTVNRCAECVRGTEAVCRVAGREIDRYRRSTTLVLALAQDCDGLKRHSAAAQEHDKLQSKRAEKFFV